MKDFIWKTEDIKGNKTVFFVDKHYGMWTTFINEKRYGSVENYPNGCKDLEEQFQQLKLTAEILIN